MPLHCNLVRVLKDIIGSAESSAAHGLSYVAIAALNIIKDICEGGIKPLDIPCLADLVVEINHEGYGKALVDYLREDMHDCHVCAALAEEVSRRRM